MPEETEMELWKAAWQAERAAHRHLRSLCATAAGQLGQLTLQEHQYNQLLNVTTLAESKAVREGNA